MIYVDTNVVSELMRPEPDPAVMAWSETLSPESVKLSVIVVAEIESGVARLPKGRRKSELAETAKQLFRTFGASIVPFTVDHVEHYAEISRIKKASGRALAPMDNLIAAMALREEAALATRNQVDFADIGLTLINPWDFNPLNA